MTIIVIIIVFTAMHIDLGQTETSLHHHRPQIHFSLLRHHHPLLQRILCLGLSSSCVHADTSIAAWIEEDKMVNHLLNLGSLLQTPPTSFARLISGKSKSLTFLDLLTLCNSQQQYKLGDSPSLSHSSGALTTGGSDVTQEPRKKIVSLRHGSHSFLALCCD